MKNPASGVLEVPWCSLGPLGLLLRFSELLTCPVPRDVLLWAWDTGPSLYPFKRPWPARGPVLVDLLRSDLSSRGAAASRAGLYP